MAEPHDVKCPHCGDTLYRTGPLAPGLRGVTTDSPDLEHDEHGYFKTCPHCQRRVPMRVIPAVGGHPGTISIARDEIKK